MISRYTRPEMGRIWRDEYRFQKMLEIEILVCEALANQGKIPFSDLRKIKKHAKINLKEIENIERVVRHDLIAFLTQIERTVGQPARHLHLGLTSSDILDTALAVQLVEATTLLQKELTNLTQTVAHLARRHKNTLMAGRTHGVHAEPITFGLKLAGWYSELKRDETRVQQAKEIISFGKISGAVGTYAHIDPKIEKYVCKKLHLKPEPVSTQIVPRDRHAQYLSFHALIASSLERFALEIRHLQRTELLEVEEPFRENQRGSSAMPHKRNPIGCENICGLARLIRSYAQAALENVALWHERDISHSSVERVILPDATILLHFMIGRLNEILKGLVVYPERMKENMNKTASLLSSQRIMLELLKRSRKKQSREASYKIVQNLAQRAWTQNEDFRSLILNNPEIRSILGLRTIEDCFDLKYLVRHVHTIFRKAGLS